MVFFTEEIPTIIGVANKSKAQVNENAYFVTLMYDVYLDACP